MCHTVVIILIFDMILLGTILCNILSNYIKICSDYLFVFEMLEEINEYRIYTRNYE